MTLHLFRGHDAIKHRLRIRASPSLARAFRQSYRLFPSHPATVRIHRRPWWSGILISRAWSMEWADAYRTR